MKYYIGIDNGVSGALAIIASDGHLVLWQPLPIQNTQNGNEIDAVKLHTTLWMHASLMKSKQGELVVVIEKPAGSRFPKMGASMAGSFHAIRAVLEILRIRYHRITPQQWQKAILKCKTGQTKPAAKTKAKALWPNERWLETDKCSKPHDGGIDAALIAEYGRMNNL